MCEVMKQRKQWDEDRHAKITDTIARSMKQWDDEHYPRLLEATWGWHPFYVSFVTNPLSTAVRPSYPLHHSVVEGLNVHALLLQKSHVQRLFPVPWCVLLIRCFLQFQSLLPPLVSHPHNGGNDNNVRGWLSLTKDIDGSGSRTWQLAKTYLKREGFLMFAGARSVDSQHDWEAEVEDAWVHLNELDELRNIADNIVRERLEHSEVLPLAHTGPPTDASSCEMAQSHSQTPTDIGTSAKDGGPEGVGPFFETHVSDVTEEGQCVQRHMDVRPAFDIPMTQAKSLE